MDQRIENAISQMDDKRGHNSENVEDRVHVSPTNGNLSHHHSNGSRSNGEISTVSVVNARPEFGNEEGFHVRSIRRQAALKKFLMKRKDRCFEKKVRYESRKKLAEQPPRVKGQFVRQVSVSNNPPPDNSSSG